MPFLIVLSLLIVNCLGLYPKNGNIKELTPTNFEKIVINSDKVWMVQFFAPWCGHCQKLVPEYMKAANALKGIVEVGAVNADKFKDLARRYNVQGLPTIYFFGANKQRPSDYNGIRIAEKIVESALSSATEMANKVLHGEFSSSERNVENEKRLFSNSINIIHLTDSSFDEIVVGTENVWIINFYAPWCGYCQTFAPQWMKAAEELDGKIKFGVVDSTVHKALANKYQIYKYPTIKMFLPKLANSPINYDGEFDTNTLVNWILENVLQFLPVPKLIQIVDESSFMEACENKPLCIITILPDILDCQSDCRNTYLNIIEKIGEQFKQNFWGWSWAEGGSQPHLEDALNIGGFGYPALVAMNMNKLKYSIFRGAFSEKSLRFFLKDLSYGRGTIEYLKNKNLLDVITAEKWDGKDRVLSEAPETKVSIHEKDEL